MAGLAMWFMDDWQRELTQQLELWANEWDGFWDDVAQEVTKTVEALSEIPDAIAEEIYVFMEDGADELDAWFDLLLGWEVPSEINRSVDLAVRPITQAIDPFLQEHPVCAGCRHYHGQVYGNQLLVCGMHPYGPAETDSCADWESFWNELSDRD